MSIIQDQNRGEIRRSIGRNIDIVIGKLPEVRKDNDVNNLFDAIPDTVGYYRSTSAGLGGDASGVQVQPVVWNVAGGASDYVNFIITDAAGADTAGYIYFTVVGR